MEKEKKPSTRVLEVSKSYNRTTSFELFARLQGYSTVKSAYVAVARWRENWPDLFPVRVVQRVSKYSPEVVSRNWIEAKSAKEAAALCGYTSVSAFKMLVSRLRSFYGEEMFPRRCKAAEPKLTKSAEARIKSASVLWRAMAPTSDVAACLGKTNAELSIFIEEYRSRNGLAMFPYRGLVIR
jgi:hypothetical protein